MKILYVTTIGCMMGFFENLIKELIDDGNVVDIATNENGSPVPSFYRKLGCNIYHIDSSRSPFSFGNIRAIRQIRELVKKNGYDIVHCHSPLAAASTRIACKGLRRKGRVKVIYTAHGFHFYKGAPLKNWVVFYPIEKFCSRYTDVLITINKEDYELAKNRMKAESVEYVPGVGIDLKKFEYVAVDMAVKRKELGIPENAMVLLSVGELNRNKNHETVIRAILGLDVYYVVAGSGDLQGYLQGVIEKLGLTEHVKLLGYRSDVAELYKTADMYILPSIREGLNVSLMEAMASGLPVACGKIRGNVDLIDDNGGALFAPPNVNGCRDAIEKVLSGDMSELGRHNQEKIKKFSVYEINRQMEEIYF